MFPNVPQMFLKCSMQKEHLFRCIWWYLVASNICFITKKLYKSIMFLFYQIESIYFRALPLESGLFLSYTRKHRPAKFPNKRNIGTFVYYQWLAKVHSRTFGEHYSTNRHNFPQHTVYYTMTLLTTKKYLFT